MLSQTQYRTKGITAKRSSRRIPPLPQETTATDLEPSSKTPLFRFPDEEKECRMCRGRTVGQKEGRLRNRLCTNPRLNGRDEQKEGSDAARLSYTRRREGSVGWWMVGRLGRPDSCLLTETDALVYYAGGKFFPSNSGNVRTRPMRQTWAR